MKRSATVSLFVLPGVAFAALAVLATASCNRAEAPAPAEVAPVATAPSSDRAVVSAPVQVAAADVTPATTAAPAATDQPPAHDPSHPPIDCPLAKAGVDPSHMKPFADTEAYIAHLERPDRAVWQKPDAVVAALHLGGAETVFDLGAGSGYFSFRFARAVPKGKVVAADTDPEMVRHIHHVAMQDSVANVEATVITVDDPAVTPDADVVFLCDVLHHVADRPTWMAKLFHEMKPGARLVIIEFKEGDLPQGPPAAMKLSHDEIVKLATDAGLTADSEQPELLPYQLFLVFRKA